MITIRPQATRVMEPESTGRPEHVNNRPQSADLCPRCGQPGTLIPLGMRYDHARWWPWSVKATPLALCGRCDALVVGAAAGASTVTGRFELAHGFA